MALLCNLTVVFENGLGNFQPDGPMYGDIPRCINTNKQILFETVLEHIKSIESTKAIGNMIFSKYDCARLPDTFTDLLKTQVSISKNSLTFPPPHVDQKQEQQQQQGLNNWYLNFADPGLFGYADTQVFAQDEHMVAEHLGLLALRNELDEQVASILLPSTERMFDPAIDTKYGEYSYDVPTPCLVSNVARLAVIDHTRLYGNKFSKASKQEIVEGTKLLDNPTYSNILAIAAPINTDIEGNAYTCQELYQCILVIYSGFLAVKKESTRLALDQQMTFSTDSKEDMKEICIHSGLFGCGAFGGNPTVMILLQCLVARSLGIDKLIFYCHKEENRKVIQHAIDLHSRLFVHGSNQSQHSIKNIIDTLRAQHFVWGVPNGT